MARTVQNGVGSPEEKALMRDSPCLGLQRSSRAKVLAHSPALRIGQPSQVKFLVSSQEQCKGPHTLTHMELGSSTNLVRDCENIRTHPHLYGWASGWSRFCVQRESFFPGLDRDGQSQALFGPLSSECGAGIIQSASNKRKLSQTRESQLLSAHVHLCSGSSCVIVPRRAARPLRAALSPHVNSDYNFKLHY
ncbi:hypothetical protein BD626DRAFT_160662 [Schizophyllum amplum]|uniref:Uncharacterized protein n=1 Tax=Schizophyllum amplum TaxID=97359 RepID=A0A550CP23_9AGAR|nr:hypothetical protein BD626DRAFT_160662 [Auriculariopsis ampla]